MMPERLFVPGEARLYLGPAGTPMPTDPAGPYDPQLLDVGFFTGDALRFSTDADVEAARGHQSTHVARYRFTTESATVQAQLQEWSAPNLLAVHGGGTLTETYPGSRAWRFSPPPLRGRAELAAVLRCRDGARTYALAIPRCQQIEGVEQDLSKATESELPLRLGVWFRGGQVPWWWVTDDALFVASPAAPGAALYPWPLLYPSPALYPSGG